MIYRLSVSQKGIYLNENTLRKICIFFAPRVKETLKIYLLLSKNLTDFYSE